MNIHTFNAFRSRNYRLFFTGQSVSLIGTWMQKTAVSWVVYSLTHSQLMLGLTLFASLFPSFLFSSVGGVVADRYNRYRLLLITQVASLVQALALTLLVYCNFYPVEGILVLSAVLGVINAFDVPARQSLVYEMVEDKNDLPNALALNSSMVNLSRLIGPALSGLVIQQFGEDICFALNTLSFVAVIGSLLMMKLPKGRTVARHGKMAQELKDGIRYIRQTPVIGSVLLQMALLSLLALPFMTLIPVYAKDIFKGSASTFGMIDSFIGLGALAGALLLASIRPGHDLKRMLGFSALLFGAGLLLFSHTTIYGLSLAFAALAGFGMMAQSTISNTLIQTQVAPEMRGRVISIYAMLFFGMQPLGGLLIGFLSQHIGTPDTVLIEGVAALLSGAFYFYWLHRHKEAAAPGEGSEKVDLLKIQKP